MVKELKTNNGCVVEALVTFAERTTFDIRVRGLGLPTEERTADFTGRVAADCDIVVLLKSHHSGHRCVIPPEGHIHKFLGSAGCRKPVDVHRHRLENGIDLGNTRGDGHLEHVLRPELVRRHLVQKLIESYCHVVVPCLYGTFSIYCERFKKQ